VDVRIGVTQSPRELEIEIGDSADRDQIVEAVEAAMADDSRVLWLTDRKGRRYGVPSGKVAYIEIGESEERRVGFSSS
jgi:hypothetical protein